MAAPNTTSHSTSLSGIIVRIVVLGAVLATAVYLVPLLIQLKLWMWLVIVVLATLAMFALYSTKRFIPGKYIFPGSFFLAVFLIVPIILTVGYSFTNYGDGSRGDKQQAIDTITNNSVQQTEDSPVYNMSVATTGAGETDPDSYVLYLVDPADGSIYRGSNTEELTPVAASDVTVEASRVTEAEAGYTLLNAKEINADYDTISQVAVAVSDTAAIRAQGINQAFEGQKTMVYDEASDSITNSQTGMVYTVQKYGDSEYFTGEDGSRLPQSWLQNVGWSNYARLFSNAKIGASFLKVFVWTLAFALLSVLTTFIVGLFLAITLNDERIRGRKLYRSFLLLPYAVPGFIALLTWSGFFNKDFGLINQLAGLDINWLGNATWAKVAVLLTNLWMGFPYMFIVSTGALQSISPDLKEAARIDGASGFQITSRIVTPLLLVAVSPLLISSFAFNFNNFNAIQLLTEGGPFPTGDYTAGGTDILISMIYRQAFGGSGADFGFASAMSVALFILTGVLAAIQFRASRSLEEIN